MIIVEQKIQQDAKLVGVAADESQLWGTYPARDFGLSEQKRFRTVEDFDAKFGARA